jgi:stage V sporulation protein G
VDRSADILIAAGLAHKQLAKDGVGMKITDVKVFPVDEEKLKAYATITFDNCFIVRDLKVISGNKGYFIAMPSKKRKDGTFRDVAHPLNSETRKMIEDAVLEVYESEAASVSLETEAASVSLETEAASVSLSSTETAATESDSAEHEDVEPIPSDSSAAGNEGAPSVEEGEAETAFADTEDLGDEPETEEDVKNPTDNPDVEPSQDPEKAFGYEE